MSVEPERIVRDGLRCRRSRCSRPRPRSPAGRSRGLRSTRGSGRGSADRSSPSGGGPFGDEADLEAAGGLKSVVEEVPVGFFAVGSNERDDGREGPAVGDEVGRLVVVGVEDRDGVGGADAAPGRRGSVWPGRMNDGMLLSSRRPRAVSMADLTRRLSSPPVKAFPVSKKKSTPRSTQASTMRERLMRVASSASRRSSPVRDRSRREAHQGPIAWHG